MNCYCNNKDFNYENEEELPVYLKENEENKHWKILKLEKKVKIEDFTVNKWKVECKECKKIYIYTYGIDLESDWNRILQIREEIQENTK